MSYEDSSPFARWTNSDVVDLVDNFPLAWVVSAAPEFTATPLPTLIECSSDGTPIALNGHFARTNPQVDRIRAAPRTLFLFNGPSGYISPELVSGTRDWAPTWNYAVASITADVAFDEQLNDESLSRLVSKMEHGRVDPWSVMELGPRYAMLRKHIIAFRAKIRQVEARFKLGQDERPGVLADIVGGHADPCLTEWMRRFNSSRV